MRYQKGESRILIFNTSAKARARSLSRLRSRRGPAGLGDYAIFGGQDHKTGQARNTETCFRKVATAFLKLAPQVKIDHRWSGQVIVANDGLPYIGTNEAHQFIATGFCGNGFTFGTIAAVMARDWITGVKNPWRDLFSPDRKKVRGGTWDYLRENKDYPYYLIQDRFRSPEGKSVRAVKRGEGKILKLGGKNLRFTATIAAA